jgi:ribosomal protein S18 acetylase RimI-like enzyme
MPESKAQNPEPLPKVVALPQSLRLQGAIRLIPAKVGDATLAGQRFLESARLLNIDLSLMFGVLDPGSGDVRQSCLIVPSPGRTAMLFVSSDQAKPRAWSAGRARRAGAGADAGHVDRLALVRHACAAAHERGCTLVQALLEERERDVGVALQAEGFTGLGELAYLRRPLAGASVDPEVDAAPAWPEGVAVRSLAELEAEGLTAEAREAMLGQALTASYEQTLDCPELCGLRDIDDVIASHTSVGVFDPALWWIVSDASGPQGCLLLSVVPDHDSIELVYIGLSPTVRGKGLASMLMSMGIAALYRRAVVRAGPQSASRARIRASGGLTCAVDMRNGPALRLYQRLGFVRTGLRLPWVKSLRPHA